jgi:hypothetical protein
MHKVRGRIPVDAIVLSKVRVTNPYGKRVIQTEYIIAEKNGLRAITDKEQASKILGTQIIQYIQRESVLPATATIVETESNDDFELKLNASKFDVFDISLKQEMLDSNQPRMVF